MTNYVTPPLAEELKEREIAFLDTAGNAYLEHPAVLIYIGERSKTPAKTNDGERDTRTFNPSGLQVILPLLCHPEWADRPYLEIDQIAGVAHGTVGWVLAELPRLGFIAEVGGRRRLLQPERLLQQWIEAYARLSDRDCCSVALTRIIWIGIRRSIPENMATSWAASLQPPVSLNIYVPAQSPFTERRLNRDFYSINGFGLPPRLLERMALSRRARIT